MDRCADFRAGESLDERCRDDFVVSAALLDLVVVMSVGHVQKRSYVCT